MSFLKRITSLLILLCFAWMLACPAAAAPDTGSIRLQLTCEGEPVAGGTLTLYRVGEPGEGVYDLCDAFRDSGADLTKLTHPNTAKTLADYAAAHNIQGQTLTVDEAGTVCFEPLEMGVYLIVQPTSSPGYEPIRPFLVTIPLTVGEDIYYDIDASPKVALTPEPSEETKPTDPWLPQTGQLNWPIPMMAAAGILLLGAGGTLYLGKRKEHEK